MEFKKAQKFSPAGFFADQVIDLAVAIIVIGYLFGTIGTSIVLTGTANTTFYGIQSIVWVAFGIMGIGLIVLVARMLGMGGGKK